MSPYMKVTKVNEDRQREAIKMVNLPPEEEAVKWRDAAGLGKWQIE